MSGLTSTAIPTLLSSISSDRFLLASKPYPSHIQVISQPFLIAFSTLLATFQSFLFATEKDVSGDKSSLESSEATDKETQVY